MKHSLLSLMLVIALGGALTARGGISYSVPASGTILDGDTAGWSATATTTGFGSALSDITVSFNISEGYNGDLYAYLSYGGVLVPLLNRIGVSTGNDFGYSGAGMNVTLSDSGSVNIHMAGNAVLSGTYKADGQNIDPLSPSSSFEPNGGSILLDSPTTGFGGMNPNGTWTILFADMSAGGGSPSLLSWSLSITAVPEPVPAALAIFGGLGVLVIGKRHAWRH